MIEYRQEMERALESMELTELDRLVRDGDPGDFETLREIVRNDNSPESHRRRALYALGSWPDRNEEALEIIRSVFTSLDDQARISAVSAVGRIGTPEARELLGEVRDDPVPEVRRAIIKSLSRIGDKPARAELRAIVDEEEEENVRKLAADRLDRMEDTP